MFGSQNVPVYCHFGNFGMRRWRMDFGHEDWQQEGLQLYYHGIPLLWTKHYYNSFLFSTFQKTYNYDFKLGSDKYVYNLPGEKTDFDSKETKLPTYWNTPFSKICLGIKINQQLRFIVINKQASSLHKLSPLNDRWWKIPQYCTESQHVEEVDRLTVLLTDQL